MREILEMIPGMDSTSIDDIIKKFQLFHEISIDTEDLESGVCIIMRKINHNNQFGIWLNLLY